MNHKAFMKKNKDMFIRPEEFIPQNTYYCYVYETIYGKRKLRPCPFWRKLDFMPKEQNGYCHFLDKSDAEISFMRNTQANVTYSKNPEEVGKTVSEVFGENFPSSLLFDRCKECGVSCRSIKEE